jgi:hypothetical protein
MIHIGVYKEYVGMYKIEYKNIEFNICKITIMSVLITIGVIAFVALCIWYYIVPTSPPPPPPSSLPPQPTRKRSTLSVGTADQIRRCNACGTLNTIPHLRTLDLGRLPPAEEKERAKNYGPANFTCTCCGAEQVVPNPPGKCYINNAPLNVSTSDMNHLADAGAGCLTISKYTPGKWWIL